LSFFSELKRRNVFRVGIAYAVTTWVLLQIIDVVAPLLQLPEWAPKLIFLILAVGFFPALIFAWAFELTPDGLKRERHVDRSQSITDVTGRKIDRMIIAVLGVAVVLLIVDRVVVHTEPDADREVATTSSKSIAVLPFVNMSSDEEQEYFSDGITEEILNSLAAVKELKVAGRTSSFAFKGKNEDLRKIGDTLGVEHILEGSVRKSGARVRITAQLIQVDDGFHLWSETYDKELTDVFAIQEEIATEILRQLRARLLDEEIEAFEPQATDPETYDLYLLAKQRLYTRTEATIESAVELLDRAIERDPGYAPAYAQRGIATIMLSERSYGTVPEADAQRNGKRFLDRALEIDPNLAEAWGGLGLYYANRQTEHEQATEALTRALELNPNNIDASNWLYVNFSNTGQAANALAMIEYMTERDPLYKPAFGNGVQAFNDVGQRNKAQALIDRFRRFDPNDPVLLMSDALHHFYRGEAAGGYQMARRAMELAPTDSVVRFVWSIALLQTLQIEELSEDGQDFFQVDALDALGRRDAAFDLAYRLEKEGYIGNLFTLLNRAGRSQELVDYVEERWPTVEAFAADYPRDANSYSVMASLALAYKRSGNTARFNEALELVGKAMSELSGQGIDQLVFYREYAKYYALADDPEAALEWLARSIDTGIQDYAPLATLEPSFESLRDDPRFLELEATMIDNINEDRTALGLAAIDPYTEFWQ